MFTRILRLVVIGWIVSMVAGAVAALQARRRIGPNSPETADDIVASAIFGPLDYHSTALNLRSGTLELWYGGGVLDLRDATLAPGGANLNVKVVLGGGQILVPADWRVVSSVSGLGGLQDVRGAKGYAEDAPTLTITGTLIGGGFAVQSEPDEAMAAMRDGVQGAREKLDDAIATAQSKVDEVSSQAQDKIAEVTGQGQDALADATGGAAATIDEAVADTIDHAASAIDDAPTEKLDIDADSEMTPAT